MTILRRLSVALLLPLMLATSLADAQSPIKPRVRTEADITPDTACGALATGRHAWTRIVTEYQEPHARVNAAGYWVGCGFALPADPPPPPKACQAAPRVVWSTGAYTCSAGGGQRLEHGQRHTYRPPAGAVDGVHTLRCDDGRLAAEGASVCSRVSECVASGYRTSDTIFVPRPGGEEGDVDAVTVPLTWSGRLREGARAWATSEDGQRRAQITCERGQIRRVW